MYSELHASTSFLAQKVDCMSIARASNRCNILPTILLCSLEAFGIYVHDLDHLCLLSYKYSRSSKDYVIKSMVNLALGAS